MKFLKKNKIYKIIIFLILPISTFFSFCFWDIMSDVFQPSQKNIIYIWNKKDDVWKTVLQEKTSATIGYNGNWRGVSTETNDSLIVRIVKFILKMTVVLSVTMVIFYSAKFLIQVFNWNDLKSATAKKDIINLIIWLLIALLSVVIVELVISIPKSSLKTSGDITSINNEKILL